jgi:hypothetical protein
VAWNHLLSRSRAGIVNGSLVIRLIERFARVDAFGIAPFRAFGDADAHAELDVTPMPPVSDGSSLG